MKTDYAGIDYGFGKTNIDLETGIRYGVISQNSLPSWIWDDAEPVYGECECENPDWCNCEPLAWKVTAEDFEMSKSADRFNFWVFKSPVKIRAQFCSPCCPGAGNLDSPCDDGVYTYAVPLEFWGNNCDVEPPYDSTEPV